MDCESYRKIRKIGQHSSCSAQSTWMHLQLLGHSILHAIMRCQNLPMFPPRSSSRFRCRGQPASLWYRNRNSDTGEFSVFFSQKPPLHHSPSQHAPTKTLPCKPNTNRKIQSTRDLSSPVFMRMTAGRAVEVLPKNVQGKAHNYTENLVVTGDSSQMSEKAGGKL